MKWWSDCLPGYEGSESDSPSQSEDSFFYDQSDFLFDPKTKTILTVHEIDDIEEKFKELGFPVKSLPKSLLNCNEAFKEFYRPDTLVSFREHFCLNMMSTSRKQIMLKPRGLSNSNDYPSNKFFNHDISPDNSSPYYDVNELSPFKVRSGNPDRRQGDKRWLAMDPYALRALTGAGSHVRNLSDMTSFSPKNLTNGNSQRFKSGESETKISECVELGNCVVDGVRGHTYHRMDTFITTNFETFRDEQIMDLPEEVHEFIHIGSDGSVDDGVHSESEGSIQEDENSFVLNETTDIDIRLYNSYTKNNYPVSSQADQLSLYPEWIGQDEESSDEENEPFGYMGRGK